MSQNETKTPIDLNRYIKLISTRAFSDKNVKAWYRCVQQTAPSGVTSSVATIDDDGNQQDVRMVHRTTEHGHEYLIPLTRDLGLKEVDRIVDALIDALPERDFDIETNETKLLAKDDGEIPLDAAKHVALCTAVSKHRHEDWMRERTGAGWRYGTKYNQRAKTHPLILPWDQLPDRFKAPDTDWPQKLISMLNDYGYAIVHREELDRLLAALTDSV